MEDLSLTLDAETALARVRKVLGEHFGANDSEALSVAVLVLDEVLPPMTVQAVVVGKGSIEAALNVVRMTAASQPT